MYFITDCIFLIPVRQHTLAACRKLEIPRNKCSIHTHRQQPHQRVHLTTFRALTDRCAAVLLDIAATLVASGFQVIRNLHALSAFGCVNKIQPCAAVHQLAGLVPYVFLFVY